MYCLGTLSLIMAVSLNVKCLHLTHINIKQSWLPRNPIKMWHAYIMSDVYCSLKIWETNCSSISHSLQHFYLNMHSILHTWYYRRMSNKANIKQLPIGTITCHGKTTCKAMFAYKKLTTIKVHKMFSINLTLYNFLSKYVNFYYSTNNMNSRFLYNIFIR